MKNKQIVGLIVAFVLIAGVALAVSMHGRNSSDTDMMKSTSSSEVSTNSVMIKNYMFSPMAIKVKVGTKVTWTNADAVSHTVTADMKMDGAPSSMDIPQHGTYSFTFTKAGTFTYHCFPHPYMHGTVVVTN